MESLGAADDSKAAWGLSSILNSREDDRRERLIEGGR